VQAGRQADFFFACAGKDTQAGQRAHANMRVQEGWQAGRGAPCSAASALQLQLARAPPGRRTHLFPPRQRDVLVLDHVLDLALHGDEEQDEEVHEEDGPEDGDVEDGEERERQA